MYIFDISLFGIQLAPTWYGLMYAIGFFVCYQFVKKYGKLRWNDIDTLLTYIFFWVIFWWRIGYILFYNLEFFIQNPTEMIAIWKWGMSFHGWLLGVILAVWLFSKKYKYRFFEVIDPLAIIIPTALFFGRIGNYINSELLGYSPYNGPFAIYKNSIWHFPSTLLEAFLEWIILFILMIFVWKKWPKKEWWTSAIFLIGYGIARLISENFRLPDTHIGYLFWTHWITLWMLYTLPLFIVGGYILLDMKQKKKPISA
jgi:phosphatidylglycerol---prolipoprotein diacylglyceryl transferase